MANKIIMDTHMHSKASDGVWTPREVVQNAKAKGLEVIALTDHDTTFGVLEAIDEGKKQGVVVIPGIEVDAVYKSYKGSVKNIELLGLGINLQEIQPLVDKRNADRRGLLGEYVEGFNGYLSSNNFVADNEQKKFRLSTPRKITLTEVVDWYNGRNLDQRGKPYINPNPFLSKMTLVQFIADNFLESTERKAILNGDRAAGDVFKKEYQQILLASRETKPTFYEAIAAVKRAEGKAVVAHPGLSKGYEDGMIKEWESPEEEWFEENEKLTPYTFIQDLKAHGLDGVEIYNYEENRDLVNRYFSKMARRLNLITTYGSDCHGPKGKGPLIGTFGSEENYLSDIFGRK